MMIRTVRDNSRKPVPMLTLQKVALLAAVATIMVGCGTSQKRPPVQSIGNKIHQSISKTVPFIPAIQDDAPKDLHDADAIPDAVPRVEQRTIAGNRSPYRVLGKQYEIMPESNGYEEVGISSWYGTKFHGRATANGEVYDLYKMTAAHKTLPIPTYLEVTNLSNNKKAIVRVNDRGPFHGDRIIDLSFAAAKKLGFSDKGTTKVRLEAIDPVAYHRQRSDQQRVSDISRSPDYELPENTFLQVGAFSTPAPASFLRRRLEQSVKDSVIVLSPTTIEDKIYRVRIGPLTSKKRVLEITELLQKTESITPHIVRGPNL